MLLSGSLPASGELACLTTFFNPAGFVRPLANYRVFARRLGASPITLELAFHDREFQIGEAVHLRASSILWQKERLLNYGLTLLPPSCKYVAWLDSDIIFEDDWATAAIRKFEAGASVIQLFDRVFHLPPNDERYRGRHVACQAGYAAQAVEPEFRRRRLSGELPPAAPGFAWAARRDLLVAGLYDRHVLGGNDGIFIGACLGCHHLHTYYKVGKGTRLLADIIAWSHRLGRHHVEYLPIPIYHLYHGSLERRGYAARERILRVHEFDPRGDVRVHNHVFEWATNKPRLHEEVVGYFRTRREDDVSGYGDSA